MKIISRKMAKESGSNPVEMVSPKELVKRGFSIEDINAALKCLSLISSKNSISVGPETEKAQGKEKPPTMRQLHVSEAVRLTAEAQQLLLSLINSNQITPLHFEKIIEYLWMNDIRDVSLVKLEMILDVSNPTPQNRAGFHWSDTIPKGIFVN